MAIKTIAVIGSFQGSPNLENNTEYIIYIQNIIIYYSYVYIQPIFHLLIIELSILLGKFTGSVRKLS